MSYGVENYELSQEKLYVNVISPKRRTSTEKKNKWDKLNLSRPNVPGKITHRISTY